MKCTLSMRAPVRLAAAGLAVGLLLFASFMAPASSMAVSPGEEAISAGGNATEITASRMHYSHQTTTVVFSEDVQVIRSDFRLWCQELTVHLRREAARSLNAEGDENGGGQMDRDLGRQFEKIVAEGEVRLTMDDRQATGQRAVFDASDNTVTLFGDVVLTEGQNRIQGQKVTFFIDENRTEIAGGGEDQVKALFFPSEDDGADNGVPSGPESE